MNNNASLYIGEYNIMNNIITLYLDIIYKPNMISLSILLPDNYPITNISTSDIIIKNGLFYGMLEIQNPPSQFWKTYLQNDINILLNLIFFYSYVKDYNIEMNDDEKIMIYGLGKKTICIAFPYIIKYYNINPKITPIVLIASGGKVITETDNLRLKNYNDINKYKLLYIYRNKYPEEYKIKQDVLIQQDQNKTAIELIILENNEKLIHYYKNNFGFNQISHTSNSTLMQTWLYTFMNHCK
jgi:hypothetical protein